MNAAVIYNPSAGKGRGAVIATAVKLGLIERGLDAELHATRGPKDATALAQNLATTVDIIVAVGGDGTVNEVANGISAAGPAGSVEAGSAEAAVREKTRLGIVPAGTVNVLALELGLPFGVDRACDVIAGGKTISLDLGRVDGRRFVLMAGAGIDALTVRHVDLRAKRRFRELAFVGSGLRHGFAAPQPEFLVRANGREYRATFVVAGNSRYYAGRLSVTRSAVPTDGLLDLLIFTGTGRPSLAVFWLEVLCGLHLRDPNVTYLRVEGAELIPTDERQTIWFQTDGELAGRLPAIISVDPHALDVLVT